jgi:hypothetical protein
MTLGSHQQTVGRSQNHITPKWIIDRLGPFDLDPYAADPRPWPCAATNWTTHGLERDWFGFVYLNPPFDQYIVGTWIARLARHGNGICLLHARTEAGWLYLFGNTPLRSCSWQTGSSSVGRTDPNSPTIPVLHQSSWHSAMKRSGVFIAAGSPARSSRVGTTNSWISGGRHEQRRHQDRPERHR